MSEERFVLRTLIRGVLEETDESDPAVLTAIVLGKIGRKDRDSALQQSLRMVIRQVFSETRAALTITPPTLPLSGKSAKGAAIRQWSQQLRQRVHTSDGYKLLGDCTYPDLTFAAQERRDLASRNRAKAAQYELLASLLTEHSAATVRDLPTDVLRSYLEAA